MKHMLKQVAVLLLLTVLQVNATVRLPGFFNDHMVLQRDVTIPIWGWADPGESVTVKFAGQKVSTKASKDGKWNIRLKPMRANLKGQNLSIGDMTIKDVLVGEVWIASGQSNMQWRVKQSMNSEEEIASAKYPKIRQLNMARTAAYLPNTNAQGEWSVCSPETAGHFTGVGYFFARKLFKEINVPIGIIDASWGGTGVEPWISQLGFNMIQEVEKERNEVNVGLPTTP